MAVKNAILKALIEGEITDLMVKTGVENVVLMDGDTEKTLATKLAEIIAALNEKATTAALTSGLAGKANTSHTHAQSDVSGLDTALSDRPTMAEMTSAISSAIDELIGGAPTTYDTLKEIADYIATHEEVTTALNAAIGNKLDKTVFESFQATLGELAGKNKVSESDLDTALAEKVNAASEGNHSHSNKTVLDAITSAKTSNWDAAYTHSQTAHAPSTAQANVIESIKVNGAAQAVSSKAVNLSVPVIYAQAAEPAALKAGDLWFQVIE